MDSKKKCRQYSADYIKYGFVKSPCNEQLPMCLLCDQVFSNEGMKPSRMIVHLKSRHGTATSQIIMLYSSKTCETIAKRWAECLEKWINKT